jgi:hypothetical protein
MVYHIILKNGRKLFFASKSAHIDSLVLFQFENLACAVVLGIVALK